MKNILLIALVLVIVAGSANSQQCLTTGSCTNFFSQYPTGILTLTSSWTTRSGMNGGNWTLFNVTSGNTYEWTYCEAYFGVSTNWNAQLTLYNYSTGSLLCYSDNNCGTNGNAPYIRWLANFTGVVRLLTSVGTTSGCQTNAPNPPFNTLAYRQSAAAVSTVGTLAVTVNNINGTSTPLPAANGTVVLFDSGYQPLNKQANTNSSGIASFSNLAYGNYIFEGYHTPSSPATIFGSEFWGSGNLAHNSANSQGTITRNMPYSDYTRIVNVATGLDVTGGSVPAGTQLRIDVKVKNPGTASKNVKARFVLGRNKDTSYDLDQTSAASTVNARSGSANGEVTFSYSYTPTLAGDYFGVTGTMTNTTGTNFYYTDGAAWGTSKLVTVTAVSTITTIQWSGYTWNVKNGNGMGPGPNNWLANSSNVWVDANGNLHLKIVKIGEKWYCSEIYSQQSFGYGEYKFEVSTNVENFDKNIVLGLFTYENDTREIDLEFARLGNASNPVGGYVVQPSSESSKNSFPLNLTGSYSTHRFKWEASKINFQSYHGHGTENLIKEWTYTGTNIPPSLGNDKVHLNLWLFKSLPPSDNNEVEVVIKSFAFRKIEPTISLTVPNGGEKWEIGEKKLIQWKSTYLMGRVNIEINGDYPNRGWDPLAMNVPDDGSYLYSVDGTEGSTKRIRISSVNNSNIKAEPGNLTFTKPIEFITLTSPKGGEQWPIGTIQTIKWETNSLFQNVNIEVNGNHPNGLWETIKSDIPNDKVFFYTVDGTEGKAKRIRVSLKNKPAVKGESENFSFTQPIATIAVNYPKAVKNGRLENHKP